MTVFRLKIIAMVTMSIDHLGLFFFPHLIILRLIGRMSFPLFAFLIANGARHTHNSKKYLARLFVFALISQIPFILASRQIDPSFWLLNVFFTLFLGLLGIELIKKTKNQSLWLLIAAALSIFAYFLKTDYGAGGVLSIIAFYLFYKDFKKLVFSQILISAFIYFLPSLYLLSYLTLPTIDTGGLLAPFSLLSLAFIYFYNQKEGPKLKYLFYLFYPLHFLIIYFLKIL